MPSWTIKWLVHYNSQLIKIDEGDSFNVPTHYSFKKKWGLTLEALKRKFNKRLRLQPLDQVYDILFWYPQVVGCGMLKFIAVQLVDDEDVEAMIYVICQSEILQYCELNANIELHTFPIPNPQPVPHQSQYYPQSHYSHASNATKTLFL